MSLFSAHYLQQFLRQNALSEMPNFLASPSLLRFASFIWYILILPWSTKIYPHDPSSIFIVLYQSIPPNPHNFSLPIIPWLTQIVNTTLLLKTQPTQNCCTGSPPVSQSTRSEARQLGKGFGKGKFSWGRSGLRRYSGKVDTTSSCK